ncbi:hypothetical protein AGMMS49975_01510 [Clostridia bacterium]|nr:hypothetical protein AGMMS49975_01510 [Clostridia bacterium]
MNKLKGILLGFVIAALGASTSFAAAISANAQEFAAPRESSQDAQTLLKDLLDDADFDGVFLENGNLFEGTVSFEGGSFSGTISTDYILDGNFTYTLSEPYTITFDGKLDLLENRLISGKMVISNFIQFEGTFDEQGEPLDGILTNLVTGATFSIIDGDYDADDF